MVQEERGQERDQHVATVDDRVAKGEVAPADARRDQIGHPRHPEIDVNRAETLGEGKQHKEERQHLPGFEADGQQKDENPGASDKEKSDDGGTPAVRRAADKLSGDDLRGAGQERDRGEQPVRDAPASQERDESRQVQSLTANDVDAEEDALPRGDRQPAPDGARLRRSFFDPLHHRKENVSIPAADSILFNDP
ncbi:MAG: hypothetical protein A2Z34_06320 [Planctomycetes bacterium RBG_16_59_8]|nr:MAG: hypothetical protein A2Z34_06320 [Planctomycetes bacterium RBG_16_59_8]